MSALSNNGFVLPPAIERQVKRDSDIKAAAQEAARTSPKSIALIKAMHDMTDGELNGLLSYHTYIQDRLRKALP